jgi:ubiquinone/menaquinone biosynthesis C-methylase UbiE
VTVNCSTFLDMDHSVAFELLRKGIIKTAPAHWADLGAGTGVFTTALAQLLAGEHDIIYAIDQDEHALDKISTTVEAVKIMRLPLNFVVDELPLKDLDGVLMANSLHFVEDKIALLAKIKRILKPDASLLIVEYDTLTPNKWIPYPINFVTLQKIMIDMGFVSVTRLGDHPSVYNHNLIYSAIVK